MQMATTSITNYLELPRSGQCHSSRERVAGVGPCVQIVSKWIRCRDEDYDRICDHLGEWGLKLFDRHDNVKFIFHLQPNSGNYGALSDRSICIFNSSVGKATEKLCGDDDEIIGHGVVEKMKFKKVETPRRIVTMKFKLLVVFKSGCVSRLTIGVTSEYYNMQMTIKRITENKSAIGTLIAAPIIDKSSLVLIYEDTIVKGDGTVCRGTPAEGRKIIFAEGGFPWKSKILLVTDDGEVHYARMKGKVGDGRAIKMPLFGSGKTTRSSHGLNIKEPTCACLWDNREIVVGNENGDMYRLDKKDFGMIDEYEMHFGPFTFLQSHGDELWIGSKEGVLENFDEIC